MNISVNDALAPHELIDAVIDWICEYALDRQTVERLIIEQQPSATEDEISELIQQAFQRIAASYADQSPLKVITEHIAIYEEVYRYYRSINHPSGMNKAMEAKERLLRIWHDNNTVTLRSIKTTVVESSAVKYDIAKLTASQQNRMQLLLEKAKG